MVTLEEIAAIAEPISDIYARISDELMLNIARHFNSGNYLNSQQWAFQKLAELGTLNKESLKIIAKNTGQIEAMIETALEQAALKATEGLEDELKEAAKKKIINGPSDEVLTSERIKNALQAYVQQSKDKLNLVNTTMLQSTADYYRQIISNTLSFAQNEAQKIVNTAAGEVITGAMTRRQALQRALENLAKQDITGFYDKSGRKWTAEAYVNMDIRTTVHNTAIETVKLRQQDYGLHIFRVSRHSGARPGCYPYQGRYFSWDNKSGTFVDGEGKQHRYYPVSSTTYGKPDGLFGINCGHNSITVIPGVSVPRDRDRQNKSENDESYMDSQRQRAFERKVKQKNRATAMARESGNKDAAQRLEAQAKELTKEYRSFCKSIGRAPRIDRTKVIM